MKKLAKAINSDTVTKDLYTQPFMFPRSLYISIANGNWNTLAKQNGLDPKELYRQL